MRLNGVYIRKISIDFVNGDILVCVEFTSSDSKKNDSKIKVFPGTLSLNDVCAEVKNFLDW
jgi:hypothetical protein